jgi:hypothetical protein
MVDCTTHTSSTQPGRREFNNSTNHFSKNDSPCHARTGFPSRFLRGRHLPQVAFANSGTGSSDFKIFCFSLLLGPSTRSKMSDIPLFEEYRLSCGVATPRG